MNPRQILAVSLPILLILTYIPSTIRAHGFGPRYDLPVPLELFLIGAGLTVALSFVLIAFFLKQRNANRIYRTYNLFRHNWLKRIFLFPQIRWLLRGLSITLLLLVITTGYFGEQDTNANFAPAFVWIIWWVGVTALVFLLGNIWPLINPWKSIFEGMETLYGKLTGGETLALDLEYPQRIGALPALILFVMFCWVENAFFNSFIPYHIASMALFYTTVTLFGMLIFGKHQWLQYGEAFSVLFRLLAAFAPTEIRVPECEHCGKCSTGHSPNSSECINCVECQEMAANVELHLRPYGVGLFNIESNTPGVIFFVIFLLSIVTFDGFKATPEWNSFNAIAIPWLASVLYDDVYVLFSVVATAGMAGFFLVFLAVFLIVSKAMETLGGNTISNGPVANTFVITLIPIALAYHLSHYLSLLLIQGQLIIPLLSDPFGFGWDLFGSANYQPNIGVVNSQFVWYFSLVTIVIGHIIAVYLAHVISISTFSQRRNALASQYPMMGLMIFYTVISLWIIAQPIIESTPQF
jgi:hypothetical protein